MCEAVEFRGQWYNSPRTLAALLGGVDRLVWKEGQSPSLPTLVDSSKMDQCLCPIDLEATFVAAGFEWRKGFDPMEWHVIGRTVGGGIAIG
jgi:hypothetical protein